MTQHQQQPGWCLAGVTFQVKLSMASLVRMLRALHCCALQVDAMRLAGTGVCNSSLLVHMQQPFVAAPPNKHMRLCRGDGKRGMLMHPMLSGLSSEHCMSRMLWHNKLPSYCACMAFAPRELDCRCSGEYQRCLSSSAHVQRQCT